MKLPMYYRIYEEGGQWRRTLYAANHKKIANSGESYWNKADCRSAINLVKASAGSPVNE